MLINDPYQIGNRLLAIRKKAGLTQAELAEKAGLADRTYADIERGTSTMRISTLMSLCRVLNVTPNDILIEEENNAPTAEEILSSLKDAPPHQRDVTYKIIKLVLEYFSDR